MEVRANYIVVGAFTLGLILAGIFFTMWIAKWDKGIPMTEYDIYMKESVTGLSVNNDVVFTGVRVGSVTRIKISETQPGAVVVRVSVTADTPVRENSEASLQIQGVTGVSIISITGGTAASPIMQVPAGTVGSIRFKPSPLASVLHSLPETLASINNLLIRMEGVFSDKNLESLTITLDSLADVSSKLAARAGALDAVLVDAEKAGGNLVTFSEKVNRMAANIEPGLKQFSNEGLTDMRMLMLEARTLVQTLTRLSKQLESDPRRFFFGESVQEYKN